MEFNTVVENRRSMRAFDANKKVTKEAIEEMVSYASLAPSWKNSQTGRYYAILDETMLEKFSNDCLPTYNANSAKNAAIIVTTFVANRSGFNKETGMPDNECGNGWGYYDLGLQNENLLLKAKEMGLDTLVMGLRDNVRIKEMLNIPEDEIVVAVLAVGYGAKEAIMPKRKETKDILTIF